MAAAIGVIGLFVYGAGLRADRALTKPGEHPPSLTSLGVDLASPGSVSEAGTGEPGAAKSAETPAGSIRPASLTVAVRYRGKTAAEWAAKFRHRSTQLRKARADLHRFWKPTVDYALRLASATFGVSYWQMRSVASCESHLYPFARNGIYRGIFQEGPMFERHPIGAAGFNVFDPLPNALVAASTVAREGWSQWECRA